MALFEKANQVFHAKTGLLSQIRDIFKKSKSKHILHSAWHYKSSPRTVQMMLDKIFSIIKRIDEPRTQGPKLSSSFSQNLGFSLHATSLFFLSTSDFFLGRG